MVARTIGERLLVLKGHSGLSLAQIALRGGYQGASSIQKLFKPDYNPEHLPLAVAEKLSAAFTGTGAPPITSLEVMALAGVVDEFGKTVAELLNYTHSVRRYVALFHTRRIWSDLATEDGNEVPLFIRRQNENGLHFPCPDHLRERGLIAYYLGVGNMWPRFEEGEVIFYEHSRLARAGDDVVVTTVHPEHQDGAMFIGRLALLHDEELQVDQLSPRGRIVMPRSRVISVRRIMQASDLLPPSLSVKDTLE